MIDFEKYKSKMTPQEAEKLDAALVRLRTLAPDAREQILHAMELMIQCDEMRAEKAKTMIHKGELTHIDLNHLDKDKLHKSLKCKYAYIAKKAKMSGEILTHDQLMNAVARVLNIGTYVDGACVLDVLTKINMIKLLIDPVELFKLDKEYDAGMED